MKREDIALVVSALCRSGYLQYGMAVDAIKHAEIEIVADTKSRITGLKLSEYAANLARRSGYAQ